MHPLPAETRSSGFPFQLDVPPAPVLLTSHTRFERSSIQWKGDGIVLGLVIFWVIMGIAVSLVANSKGRDPAIWFIYGALIWPIALVHILVSVPGDRKQCPYCAELVKIQAKVCPHCRNDLPSDFGIDRMRDNENLHAKQLKESTQGLTTEQIKELKEKNLGKIDAEAVSEFCKKYNLKEDVVISTIRYFYMRGWPST